MSLRIYFLLNKAAAKKTKKEFLMLADVSYDLGKFRFSTGLKINGRYFKSSGIRGNQQVAAGHPNAEQINQRMQQIKIRAKEIYLQAVNSNQIPEPLVFKSRLLKAINTVETEQTIIQYVDDYIAHLTAKAAAGRIKGGSLILSVKRMRNILDDLYNEDPFTFDDIDMKFETRFLNALSARGFGVNTIATYTKRLKMFLNWATKNNLNRSMIYKTFEMNEIDRDIVALNDIEVQTIADLNIPTYKNIKVGGTKTIRDWFLVSTQTGLRYSDLHKIAKPELVAVPGGYDLIVKTTKGKGVQGGLKVTIPVTPLLYRIFEEHEFNLPGLPSNHKYNRGVHKISKLAGLTKEISSKTGRKTFCTNMFKKGYPVHWIMKISGHKTEKEFYKYIGVDGSENAQLIRNFSNDFVIEHTPKMAVNK
jgi:site-specific recombinase XerD